MSDKSKIYIFRLSIVCSILFYAFYRFLLIENRYIDHDEFEHIAATWKMFNNQVAYQDFFEHHFPWLYHISQFLYLFFDNVDTDFEQTLLSFSIFRYLMQLFIALGAFIVFKIVRIYKDFNTALMTSSFFWINKVLIFKGIEFRPDVPALTMFLASIYFLIKYSKLKNKTSMFFSFICFGAAIMFTQKYLVILPIFFFWSCFLQRNKRILEILKTLCVSSVFLLTPFLITSLYYLFRGSFDDFINQNLLMNFSWERQATHWHHSQKFMHALKIEIALVIFSFMLSVHNIIKKVDRDIIAELSLSLIFWFILSLYMIPIVALQYYIVLAFPLSYLCAKVLCKIDKIKVPIFLVLLVIFVFKDYSTLMFEKRKYRKIQEKILEVITKESKPSDYVFGGNPLFSVYRRHFFKHGFLHEGIVMMLNDSEKQYIESSIIKRDFTPKFVTYDFNIGLISKKLDEFILNNYKEVPGTKHFLAGKYEIKLMKLKEPFSEDNQ